MAFGGVITGLDAPAASDPPVISVMSGASPRTIPLWKAFDARLVELGWIDGENIIIEFRNPEGSADLMAQMADELVALEPAVIVATGPEATLAAVRERAHAIPIVFVAVDYDPVDLGYVASYARPGGNVTGIAVPRGEVNAKRLQLLVEAMPSVKSVAIFGDDLTGDQAQSLEAAAGAVGLATEVVNFADPPYDFITLDIVAGAPREIGSLPVISNSFGFGGHNASLVLTPSA
jgi:putative ABC transport system substrate-binding protein